MHTHTTACICALFRSELSSTRDINIVKATLVSVRDFKLNIKVMT
jgi:hypothetical protein